MPIRADLPTPLTWQYVFGSILGDFLAVYGYLTQIDYLYSPRSGGLQPLDGALEEPGPGSANGLDDPLLNQLGERGRALTSFLMKPRALRAVFCTRQAALRWDRRPDGFEHLGRHNLFMFEPELKGDLLHELTANANDYLKGMDLWRAPTGSVSLGMFAVAAKADRALLPAESFQSLLPGVWRLEVEDRALTVIVIDYLADIPENHFWQLFSFDGPRIEHAWSWLRAGNHIGAEHQRMLLECYDFSGLPLQLDVRLQ